MNKSYFLQIYDMRYFIFHLVKWDMKYRFRRSKLGILWTIMQPLFLTLIIAFVFGTVFEISMAEYAPYILSGFLVWDMISSSVVSNSYAFIKAESYIRQTACPFIIYPVRESFVTLCTFLVAFISLAVWIAIIAPENLPMAIISLPFTLLLFFVLSVSISVITAHTHVRYRDYPYVFALVMQFCWYISPVFFQESMFKSNEMLYKIFLYNPFTSILLLIRDPFLYGKFPSLFTYGYVMFIAFVLMIVAVFINSKNEKTVIFYL